MAIITFSTDVPGQIGGTIGGVSPRRVAITSTDNLAAVTAPGYLNQLTEQSFTIFPTDEIVMQYAYNVQTGIGTYGVFTVSISNGVLTLVVVGGDNPAVVLPTIANHLATYTNITGTISEDAATAINGGNLQAGLSGTAGTLASFPATAARGSLVVKAVANTGNTITTISNAAMGQASVVSIPDPGTATANFVVAPATLVSGNLVKASGTAGLLVDAAFAVHAGTTAAFAGGGTTNTFTTTNMTAASIVTAVILASTNSVAITKALPGTNTLAVTFSADPGPATTVSWISVTPAA